MYRIIVTLIAAGLCLFIGGCATPQAPSCADQGPLRPINWPSTATYSDPVTGEEQPLPPVPGNVASGTASKKTSE